MVSSQLLSLPTEQPSISAEQGFDYATLDAETRIVVQQRTGEIKSLLRRTATEIIDIGQKLSEVKQQLGHGNFRNWLKSEFDWGIWTATKFMQVAERFECVKFTHLDIVVSALYLLASPSTPEEARGEALERASLGENITHAKAKAIVTQHRKATKPKATKTDTVDVPSETMEEGAFTPAKPRKAAYTVDAKSSAVLTPPEDKLLGKTTEAPAHFQTSNGSHETASAANCGDYPPQDQAKMEIQLPFKVGHHLCVTDVVQQDHKWFGKVAEVKETTPTDIEVVIRITLQTSTG